MNWWPCCGGGGNVCQFCTGGAPTTINAAITGFSNNSCTNCSAIDGTYALTYLSGNGSCIWYKNFTVSLGACGSQTLLLYLTLDSFNLILSLSKSATQSQGLNPIIWTKSVFGSTPIDCTAQHTLTLSFPPDSLDIGTLGVPNWACDTSSNATIN